MLDNDQIQLLRLNSERSSIIWWFLSVQSMADSTMNLQKYCFIENLTLGTGYLILVS
jgi:hypothetical protein